MNKYAARYIVSVFLLTTAACSSLKGPMYLGTNDVGSPGPDISIFPHGEGWDLSSGHGKYVIDHGSENCMNTCHGNAGSESIARDCKTCHELYPHDDSAAWQGLIGHGSYTRLKGSIDECVSCHGELNNGDCKDCHHDNKPNWTDQDHSIVAAAGADGCKLCHGADLKGGQVGVSCLNCHDDGNVYSLHTGNWNQIAAHGQSYLAEKSACKSACHGTDLAGGISGVPCSNPDCHENYPHNSEWLLSNHGLSVLTGADAFDSDKYVRDCQNCHGGIEQLNADSPSVTPTVIAATGVKRCYNCHAAYPHTAGFSDTLAAYGDVNLTSWSEAHLFYLLYNDLYNDASYQERIDGVMTLENGCSGSSRCHKSARHGPPMGFGGYCTALCHNSR